MSATTTRRPTVAFYTLGCKLNQAETDSMASDLAGRGFAVTPLEITAANRASVPDFMVINTCTVTAKADRKTRHSIYKALRLAGYDNDSDTSIPPKTAPANQNKSVVIVTGCFVGNDNEELTSLPIHYVIDNSKKKHIPDIIDAHYNKQSLDPDALPADFFSATTSSSLFKTRDNLKIQDGCDNFCTFCIIPMVRGSARSKPLTNIVQDARVLIECGTKEIILTGVNMSRYRDGMYGFSDVLESLLKLSGDFRIRVSSLEPDTPDERFFDFLHHPKLCPHLHLCLQSGSEKILLMMRRMYTRKAFVEYIRLIRKKNPLFNITTDVIVGFPEETDEDFEQTMQTVHEIACSHVHVFPYSPRTGTRASRLKNVPQHIKKQRIERLLSISIRQKNEYRKKLVGVPQRMLIEKIDGAVCSGISEYYAPIRLHAVAKNDITRLQNTMVNVRPTEYILDNAGEVVLFAPAYTSETVS